MPPPRRNTAIRRIASGLVIVLAARVAYLAIGEIGGAEGFGRHHVESATLLFALVALGHAYAVKRPAAPARELGGPALLAIPADLQGTRYLYLGQVGWATLLAALAGAIGRRSAPRRGLALAGVFTLVVINAAAVARHVQPWVEAGRLRDRVLTAAAGTSAMADCGEVTLEGLPDSIRGAYIFRNGAPEAFSRTMGIRITDTPPRVGCRFRWNAQNETFIQVTAPNH